MYVSAAGKTYCTTEEDHIATNNHEEADTLMIWHAVIASAEHSQAHSELCVLSVDTDVLVLLIAHYPNLLPNTSILLVSGKLAIGPLFHALGPETSTALVGFHAFSGCDTVGMYYILSMHACHNYLH
jgi:prephenate dehydrogenase